MFPTNKKRYSVEYQFVDNTGKHKGTKCVTYTKPLNAWMLDDYNKVEKLLATAHKGSHVSVSIIEVTEVE